MVVIKFYETGWNYIFDVESIKQLRINVEEVSKEYHKTAPQRVLALGNDRDIRIDFIDFLEKFICKKFPNQGFYGHYIHLEKDFIKGMIEDPEHSYTCFNVLIYKKNGQENMLVFNKPGFIMDQSTGGTIEKIHVI